MSRLLPNATEKPSGELYRYQFTALFADEGKKIISPKDFATKSSS